MKRAGVFLVSVSEAPMDGLAIQSLGATSSLSVHNIKTGLVSSPMMPSSQNRNAISASRSVAAAPHRSYSSSRNPARLSAMQPAKRGTVYNIIAGQHTPCVYVEYDC